VADPQKHASPLSCHHTKFDRSKLNCMGLGVGHKNLGDAEASFRWGGGKSDPVTRYICHHSILCQTVQA